MTQRNDGGPAFPQPITGCKDGSIYSSCEVHPMNGGMTLRDWFAGQADIPWNAVIETLKIKGEDIVTVDRLVEYRSLMAYSQADAMLKARDA